MSDLTPQAVPPPPPPQSAPGRNYDFLRPFTFAFEDPHWLHKILIGGLWVLASFFLIGIFFVAGYAARLTRNVIAGVPYPLPEWDDSGEYFAEGLRLFGIGIVYVMPLFVLMGAFIVPSALAGLGGSEAVRVATTALSVTTWCLFMPLSLALSVWMPGAMLFAVVERRFGAAFELGRIGRFIRENAANYVLAVLVMLCARFAAGAGFMLCIVGLLFTSFWSMCVTAYAFAQTYRLARS